MIKVVELSSKVSHWGYSGENGAVRLKLDASDLKRDWPDGVATCAFRRSDGTEYAHAVTVDGNNVYVDLNSADTAEEGVCQLTISWTVSGKIAKTMIYMGRINGSISTSGSTPSAPEQGIIEQVNAAAVRAETAAANVDNMTASATVDNTTGTPAVTVTKTTVGNHNNFAFAFSHVKGEQGATGAAGANGADGYSPTVSVSKTGGVTSVVFTDKNGAHQAVINDGARGADGAAGRDGRDGRDGSDASVTAENIETALGYTPADADDVDDLSDSVDDITDDLLTVHQTDSKQNKIIGILNNAANGRIYDRQADSTEAYQKAVPSNSVGYSVVNEIGGKTVVQDGQLVSADVQNVRSESKNLLWLTRKGESFTQGGLDITISDDGSTITMNGTTTATVRLCLWGDTNYSTSAFPFETGYYTYSVNAVSGTGSIPSLYLNGASLGGGGTRIVENGQLNTRLQIMSGVTCNNRVVQLMLERGSSATEYTPYRTPIDYSIPSAVRTSYPIRSAGSVHDSYEWDGEKWWHVKRVGKYTFNGSENWLIDSANNIKNYINSNLFYGMAKSDNYIGKMLCDRYATKASHLDGGYGISAYYDSSYQYANQNWFYASIEGLSTRKQYQNALSGATVYYELATPIRTDITSLMNWDAMLDVEADGTVTFVQDGNQLDIPSTVTHYIGVDAIRGVQVAGTTVTPVNGIANITNSALKDPVKAALSGADRISMTDDEKGNACSVLGAERKLTDGWVLKGSLTGTSVNVDLSGCTEVFVIGSSVATAESFLNTNLGLFAIATKNGTRHIGVRCVDSLMGYEAVYGQYTDTASPVRFNAEITQKYSYINGSHIANINLFEWNSPTVITSCNIKIYAR